MKSKLLIIILFTCLSVSFVSCQPDPADQQLEEMEIVISKWEKILREKPVAFDDMVLLQQDITILDLDPEMFAMRYGHLSGTQKSKILNLRSRFRRLMRR